MTEVPRPPRRGSPVRHDVRRATRNAGPRVAAEQPCNPTRAQRVEAAGQTIPHLIAPDLAVLFVGINPGLYSGAVGHHFARPGNRFWKTLQLAGFTDEVLSPFQGRRLLELGLGITNLVERTTATAAELSTDELREGGLRLVGKAERFRPSVVAVLGVSAYRVAFSAPGARVGAQPVLIGGSRAWLLPNPSGLNANYQLPRLVEAFAELRRAAFAETT